MANTTDVRLFVDQIRIEGRRQVIVDALDLCVDSSSRRTEHMTSDRRALVHDDHDALTVNYGFDYPGGVKINGLHTINARPKIMTSPGTVHLTIAGNTKIAGNLEVDGKIQGDVDVAGRILFRAKPTPGAVMINVPGQPPPAPAPPLDLAEVISALQHEVAALKKKVGL